MELLNKQTVKVSKTVEEDVELLVPNWDLMPVGSKFTGTIRDIPVSGRIQRDNEGYIFLCQDDKEGKHIPNKLGYKYSWFIGRGDGYSLQSENVSIESIELDPEFVSTYVPPPPPMKVGDYEAYFHPGYVKIGCQEISNEVVMEVVSKLIPKENS